MAAHLHLVIIPSPPVIQTLNDERVHKLLGLNFTHPHLASREEPFLQLQYGFLLSVEAWQLTLPQDHHFDQHDDLVCVFLKSHESVFHQVSKPFKLFRSLPAHYLCEFRCQLEWHVFKFHVAAGGVGEQEPEVDMEDVALDVNENIPVVSVLDCHDVAD